MKLMIVESPNKTRKIEAELGGEWKVLASAGHIRDMPRETHHSDGPPSLDEIGIHSEDFSLRYEFLPPVSVNGHIFAGGQERVARLRSAADRASAVYLATDPDREGEAISWHLKEALGLGEDAYQRVTFNEINGKAIRAALTKIRKIDLSLVHAQEARRALDRMVGYLVSPILSDLLGVSVSAGRVQSVAARLVVDRERRIEAFKRTSHFGAVVSFDGARWRAEWITKPFVSEEIPYVLDEPLARRAAACRTFRVLASQTEVVRETPPKPFSTSLMLRAASVALHLDPEATAKLAQRLFEQGAITYIRTDSVNFGVEAIAEIRGCAQARGFPLPGESRRFQAKGGAQQAHEAIRPSHIETETAGETDDERALYRLIWQRAVASQLTDTQYRVNTLILASTDGDQPFQFKARARVAIEKGWRALTASDAAREGEGEDEIPSGTVPMLEVGSKMLADSGTVVPRQTVAPKRYTKASLIEKLENEGIGRPATYPSIMATIMSRGYVSEEKHVLAPTELGKLVVETLVKAGFGFMDVAFTRHLEEQLDAIAEGKAGYEEVLAPAYRLLHDELEQIGRSGIAKPRFPCPKCGSGLYRSVHATRSAYWHCHNEDCGHYMDDLDGKPVERAVHPCPKCQSLLRRFQRKDKETGKPNGFAWFCTNSACKTFLDDDKGSPVIQKTAPCPKCGRLMLRRKSTRGTGYWWGCSGYKDGCTLKMDDRDGKPVPHGLTRSPRTGDAKDPGERPKLEHRRRKR
ncbi:type I DNA topoisomerase [Agrobacterium rhizogenes]|nr:type I DNA topoisomerase [Rhizobium rhizogenes]